MTSSSRKFVHVGTDEELEALRTYPFEAVNCCTRRKVPDDGGWWLLFVGERSGEGQDETYSGHRYIIRCRTAAMRDQAMTIIKERLATPNDRRTGDGR